MHNKTLADMQGLTQQERNEIDDIHEQLEKLISCTPFSQEVYDKIERIEYTLQSLWGFPKDPDKHTWKKVYEFRCQWIDRVFECKKTGERFTIPKDVKERDCFFFGGGAMIDVGRLECYSRFAGCFEVEVNNE